MAETTLKLPAGEELDVSKCADLPLYSVVRGIVDATSNKLMFFNYIQGETIPGTAGILATELDTNLDKASKHLGYAEEMMVHAICVQLPHKLAYPDQTDGAFLHDMIELIDKTYFTFRVNNKIYAEGTLDSFPFFGGLYVESTANNVTYVNNGVPQSVSSRPLGIPIHLTAKSTILGQFEFPYGSLSLLGAKKVDGAVYDYKIRTWLLGIRLQYEGTTVKPTEG